MDIKLILIIDDEDPVLDVLNAMIKKFGYKTECFHNVGDAIEKLPNINPDLIILDYSIPGEDGQSNIKTLLKIHPNVKIILLSGYNMTQIQELISIGVYKFLQKPVKLEDLKMSIESAFKDST